MLTTLWNKTVNDTAVTTEYTDAINMANFEVRAGTFNGLVGLSLVVTEVAATGDSLIFHPMYKVGAEWITGEEIAWDQVSTDNAWAASGVNPIVVATHTGNIYVWSNDPTDTDTIQGFPFDEFKVKRIDNGTTNYHLRLTLHRY